MDYKAILQEQIKTLQKLQEDNVKSNGPISLVVDNAVKIADQIRKIYADVKGPLD